MRTDGIRVRSVRQVPQATLLENTTKPVEIEEIPRTEPTYPVRQKRVRDPVARRRNQKILLLAVIIVAFIALTPALSTARVIQQRSIVRQSITPSFRLSAYPDPVALSYETITVPVTRSTTVPYDHVQELGQPARGVVRLFNDSGKTIVLPTGSRLTAPDGFIFTTDGPVTVPAKSRSTAGSIAVRVSGSVIGVAGNRDQEDFETIQLPGGKQVNSLVGHTESGGLLGGINLGGPVIDAESQAKILNQLRTELSEYTLPENLVPKTFTTLSGGVSAGPEQVSIVLDSETEGSARISITKNLTYVLLPVKELTNQILTSLPPTEITPAMTSTITSFQGVIARV